MRDSFFYDVFIEPFTDGFWSALLGILMWILSLMVIALVAGLIIWGIDSIGLKEKEATGFVSDKNITEAYTSTTYVMSGKIMVPITTFHPKEFYITVEYDKYYDNVSLSEVDYNSIQIGQKVNFIYGNGRIFDSFYISKCWW